MAGLLGEDYEDPATQGLLSAGLSMLAASGPSTKRTSVGQVLGLGGLQGMQAYQQAQKMALLKAEEERRKQEAAAMEEYRRMQVQQLQQQMSERQQASDFIASLPSKLTGPDGKPIPASAIATLFAQSRIPKFQELAAEQLLKEPGNIKLNRNERLIGPDGKEIVPASPAEDKYPASVQEYNFALQQGYKGSYEQWVTDKAKAGATSLSFGAPFAIQDPNDPTRKVLAQAPNRVGEDARIVKVDGLPAVPPPDKKPELKPIPPNIKVAIGTNLTSLSKIEMALKSVDENKNSLGLQYMAPDAINQRRDPNGVTTRSLIADIGSLKIHDRSGAAVTISEEPRLMPFIPKITDRWDVAKKKLEQLTFELQNNTDGLLNNFGEEQGFQPYSFGKKSEQKRYKYNPQTGQLE